MSMNLWFFLTIAVIVWGIVEIAEYGIKSGRLKKEKGNSDSGKKLEAKILQLERRIANLEAISVDSEHDESGHTSVHADSSAHADSQYGSGTSQAHEPGKLSNKLQNK